MIWFAAIALGVLIGAVLGGLGGGGAILTVPALVFVLGQTAQEATAASLVIVGVTAAVGAVSYLAAQRVRWRTALAFSALGLPGTWLGSHLNHQVEESVLLLAFAALMAVAAIAMVADQWRTSTGRRRSPTRREAAESALTGRPQWAVVAAAALGVGMLTGFFGVGGGFVIVPALVLVLRLPMHQVVGTSLVVVSLNSATSLAARAETAHFDWSVILPFTAAAMAATIGGKLVADRLPARQLTHGFAVLMILVAGYTAWQGAPAALQHIPEARAATVGGPSVQALSDVS